jgi:hypothetical protein
MTGAVPPLPPHNWWLAQGQLYLLCQKVAKYWLLMNTKLVEHLNCWLSALIFLCSDHLTWKVFVQDKLYIFRVFSCTVIFTVAKKEFCCLLYTVKCICDEGMSFFLVRRACSDNWKKVWWFYRTLLIHTEWHWVRMMRYMCHLMMLVRLLM